MARARTIKPTYFTNEQLARCEPLARILFAALWCQADKEGRLEDRPERIKLGALPYDNCDVDSLLNQLYHSGFVLRYTVGSVRVIQVVSWKKHAKCHPEEACYGLPGPPEGTTKEQENLIVPCALTLNSNLNSNSTPPTPPTGGVDTGPSPKRRKPADAPAPGFDAFWEAYPRKDAKIRAATKWNSLSPDAELQAIILAALEKHKRSRQWLREGGEFIPLPSTWLNGRYWENQGVANGAGKSPKQAMLDELLGGK